MKVEELQDRVDREFVSQIREASTKHFRESGLNTSQNDLTAHIIFRMTRGWQREIISPEQFLRMVRIVVTSS